MSARDFEIDQEQDPREGDQTEGTTRDGGDGPEQRCAAAADPREGDSTEKVEKGELAGESDRPRLGDATESINLTF